MTIQIRNIRQNALKSFLFGKGSSSSTSYFHVFFIIAFLEEVLIRTVIILVFINYIIVININDSNAVINYSFGRLQHLIVLFTIPMCTPKDLFEIYKQFGHAASKSSPALLHSVAISNKPY